MLHGPIPMGKHYTGRGSGSGPAQQGKQDDLTASQYYLQRHFFSNLQTQPTVFS